MKVKQGLPSNVYKELVAEAPSEYNEHLVTAPRDIKQVQNFQAATRQKMRISRDALYNLIMMAYNLMFVKYIVAFPDLICLMYHDSLLSKIKGLINRGDLGLLAFSFDTTFKLGDIYVSVLVVNFTEFKQKPVVPVMFMLHERKNKEAHHLFFKKLVEWFPELVNAKNAYMVTDGEEAFVSAIRKYLPNMPLFLDWIHVMKNAKLKLHKLLISSDEEVQMYMDDLRTLFGQKSEIDYLRELNSILSRPNYWHEV